MTAVVVALPKSSLFVGRTAARQTGPEALSSKRSGCGAIADCIQWRLLVTPTGSFSEYSKAVCLISAQDLTSTVNLIRIAADLPLEYLLQYLLGS